MPTGTVKFSIKSVWIHYPRIAERACLSTFLLCSGEVRSGKVKRLAMSWLKIGRSEDRKTGKSKAENGGLDGYRTRDLG